MVERAQPWLGTFVSIRVAGLPAFDANAAINAAFKDIAMVHRLMSFHSDTSDVSRMNRKAARKAVPVHQHTFDVLERALEVSACSRGCFDVSIAHELVESGHLPPPAQSNGRLDGCWRDIELHENGTVYFRRPLWIDLGGIAKGYAVDRAMKRLLEWGVADAVVNAGGDLRVCGSTPKPVGLELELVVDPVPVVEVSDGSLASSSGHLDTRIFQDRPCGPHVDGVRRTPVPPNDRFVCVAAQECIIADALTKVVIAEGADSIAVLQNFQASAYFHDAGAGWHQLQGSLQ